MSWLAKLFGKGYKIIEDESLKPDEILVFGHHIYIPKRNK